MGRGLGFQGGGRVLPLGYIPGGVLHLVFWLAFGGRRLHCWVERGGGHPVLVSCDGVGASAWGARCSVLEGFGVVGVGGCLPCP